MPRQYPPALHGSAESPRRTKDRSCVDVFFIEYVFDLINYLPGSELGFNEEIFRTKLKHPIRVLLLAEIAQYNHWHRCRCLIFLEAAQYLKPIHPREQEIK